MRTRLSLQTESYEVIFPAENTPGFALLSFCRALAYGYIAWRTGSAKWTAISHSLSGFLALSGPLAPSVLAVQAISHLRWYFNAMAFCSVCILLQTAVAQVKERKI